MTFPFQPSTGDGCSDEVGNLANGSYGYGSRTSEWDHLYQAEKARKNVKVETGRL